MADDSARAHIIDFMDVNLEKEKIRKTVLEKLKKEPFESQREKSFKIIEKLKCAFHFETTTKAMVYVSTVFEVDTKPLLKELLAQGCRVTVPSIDEGAKSVVSVEIKDPEKDLLPGSYGILEPRCELVNVFDVKSLDVILVPGLAFDRKNNRIGRGKGYYDRFLKTLPARVKRYGLAFDFQMFDQVPIENWDVPVDQVITND